MAKIIKQQSGEIDFEIEQYSTFSFTMILRESGSLSPIPLQDWTFSGLIKENKSDVTEVTGWNFDVVPAQGMVTAYLTPSQTALLVNPKYFTDILMTNESLDPAVVIRIVEGKIKSDRGVTPNPVE